jgi:HSP20 family protein
MYLISKRNEDWDNLVNEFFGSTIFSSPRLEKKVNITEDENSYGISLTLPGYSKDDINVEINDGVLTISSEINDENYKSSFDKSYYLPDDVDTDSIEASLVNGILDVTLNKIKELEDKTKVIKIDIN